MASELTLREVGPEAEGQIRRLLRECFASNSKMDSEVMHWQYWSQPFGPSHTWIVYDDERPVAHMTGYCLPLRLGGVAVKAGIQVDGVTLPEYRGRGLFGRLSNAVYDSMRESGAVVVLGNPNEASVSALRRVGWIAMDEPRLFVMAVSSSWIASRIRLPRALGTMAHRLLWRRPRAGSGSLIGAPPAGLDELSRAVWTDQTNGVRPDAAWWAWRFGEHPHSPYSFHEVRTAGRLRAAAVASLRVEEGDQLTQILDIVAESSQAAREVVDSLVEQYPQSVAVTMIATANGIQGRAASAGGMRVVPRRIRGIRSNFGVFPLVPSIVPHLGGTWSVSGGTLDYS